MFGRGKRNAGPAFDRTGKVPVIRASICTGEKVAGYRDAAGGKFVEVMLIRTDADLRQFLTAYGFEESELRYEW